MVSGGGMIGTPETRRAASIIDQIRPLLAGAPPEIQAAVLADLLALWLAGHHIEGDANATRRMRAELFSIHCAYVRELVPVNAKIIGTTP